MAVKQGQGPPSVAEVRDHAFKLAEELDKKRGITVSEGGPDAATLATMVPDFSRGTTALDDEGNPLVATQATVAPPSGEAGGSVDALAEAKAEISGEPAPTPERDEKGRFVAEAAAAEQPVAAEPAAQPTPEASVEAVAQEILDRPDPFEGYDEVEYVDPDLDQTYKVRAPKEIAQAVKRGYMRHADYTRKTMALAAVRKELQPLIEDGRITQLMPLIQRALADSEYGQFVVDAYQRRMQGLPLTPAQASAVAAVEQPAIAAPQVPVLSETEDPFMAQAVGQYLTPLRKQLEEVGTLAKTVAEREAAREAAERAQQQQQAQQAQIAYQTHQELTRRFPDTFNGDLTHDNNEFLRAINYARDSGYLQAYGSNPLAVVLAYEDLRRERAEASASPAAAAISQAQERKVAKQNAAAVPSGAPATNTAKRVVPPPPQTRVNGTAVNAKEFAAAQLARMAALAQQ